MQITVNGEIEPAEHCSILAYIESRGLQPEKVVVEHNRIIVKREKWGEMQLQDGDTLEVIALVGGG